MPFTRDTARAAAQKSAQARGGSKSPVVDADERVIRSAAPDVRGDRDGSLSAARDEAVEDLSQAELDELIASEFEQTALPNAPLIPGYHLCWLTTMSKYDTLQKRERLGYQPVRYSEVAGFNPNSGMDTVVQGDGVVTCNEMVLYKIADMRYQAVMRYFHHTRPMQEEETIVNQTKQNQKVDGAGKSLLQDGDGEEGGSLQHMETSVEYAKRVRPTFS